MYHTVQTLVLITDLFICLQYGFITLNYQQRNGGNGNGNGSGIGIGNGGGGGESIFFHMNSMASGCEFSDLHSGDEVEFLLVTKTKAKKNNAIHVKKLR